MGADGAVTAAIGAGERDPGGSGFGAAITPSRRNPSVDHSCVAESLRAQHGTANHSSHRAAQETAGATPEAGSERGYSGRYCSCSRSADAL